MSHYYTDNRDLPHDRKEISFRFSGYNFVFGTDRGVFSKDKVDTGTHILLNVIKDQSLSGNVADIGCGIGVIGIIVKKLFPETEITMVDVNSRAVELSVFNAQKNGVECNVLESNGFEKLIEGYETVICNPPIRAGKVVIYQIFDESYEHLNPGGSLWIVMRKQHGALSAIKKLEMRFNEVKIIDKDKGFYVIKATKSN